ncbi:hypothetical protein SFRURICE_006307 [Spodoptera frugiperda]|uniref:SFRICE_038602 n=1 Tax=Spodoptera frugiperda TaxID=7108 RepID=A0A2H1VWF4_SPOFR|nr:hypothetical protein SFRURICE_006307 [Spodoptera frugiperda]
MNKLPRNPPATGKYSSLKVRLISTYQKSDHRQLQKLLSGLELGDPKPSQLLRKMRDLSGKLLSDEALKAMWLNQLPTQIHAVISVNTGSSLEMLAAMADKMMEHFEPTSISSVSTTTTACQESLQIAVLSKQLEKMSLEIAELRTNQQNAGN